MKRMCRQLVTPSWRRRQMTWQEAFPHARIVTDAKKLEQLNADVAKRKRKEEADRKAAGPSLSRDALKSATRPESTKRAFEAGVNSGRE